MINKLKLTSLLLITSAVVLTGCSTQSKTTDSTTETKVEMTSTESKEQEEESLGKKMTDLLTARNWQGTRVYDANENDLTAENADFIGLAKYDGETGRYEFFDAKTKETRGDEGLFFITDDGAKRILISQTKDYQAVVDLTELTDKIFTYKRMGKDKTGNESEVFVEHIPYDETDLTFTTPETELLSETGTIETKTPGRVILSQTLWNGTTVLDEDGNDITEFNTNFISLAKFQDTDNKYEFFNLETGESRGDFGYFDVINHNKIRAHVSLGENKYGAALEITEINDKKFTYKRNGEDKDGNEITVFVEHEPYTGDLTPSFTK